MNLNTQFSNLNGEIEKFKLRWDTLKPKEEALEGGPERILQGIKYGYFLTSSFLCLIFYTDRILAGMQNTANHHLNFSSGIFGQ